MRWNYKEKAKKVRSILSKKNTTILVIIIFIIPIIVGIITTVSINIFSMETSNDWIGFFASYFGSIIGVVGVYLVMKMDQEKREEERKDNLFLQNIELYYNILKLLEMNHLGTLVQKIYELKNSPDWKIIDINTKRKIEKIYNEVDYCSDGEGLLKFLEDYIKNNFYDYIKIPREYINEESSETFNYYDVCSDKIFNLKIIIYNNLNVDLEYESNIELAISRENFFEKLKEVECLDYIVEDIYVMYSKLLKINNSEEWKDFISRRHKLFKEIDGLNESINSRINRLYNY